MSYLKEIYKLTSILQMAFEAIENMDDDLYEDLLDHTDARPETTKDGISDILAGLEKFQIEQEKSFIVA